MLRDRVRHPVGIHRRRRERHRYGAESSSGRSLTSLTAGAFGWSVTNSALTKLCTVGVGILLARLLGPHSFGTYAVASVALTIMTNFNDLGVSLAIVRSPGEPGEIAPTVATISVVTSVLLYIGCYFGAPMYAAAMGAPNATAVVRALSLIIVIDGFVTAPVGLLQRYFRQDKRTIADQVNIWLGTAVTVVLALARFGPMSLALGKIAGCLAAAILLIHFSPQPLRFGFNRREARALLRFGLPLAGSSVAMFVIANVDKLVVGRLLGVTALGFFVLGSNLSNWPAAAFSEPISQVAPSALARLQHDRAAMRGNFETMVALVSAVTLPACLVEAGSAAPLVRIVYGTRWLPAYQPLMWLAALTALQIFFQLTFDYLVVLGQSRMIFTLQMAWGIVLVPVLVAGARWHGIGGVAVAELAVAAVVPLPWYLVGLHKAGTSGRTLVSRLGLPLAGAAVAGVAASRISAMVPGALVALCWSVLAGVVVIGLLLLRMRHVLSGLRHRYAQGGGTGRTEARGGRRGRDQPQERAMPVPVAAAVTGEHAPASMAEGPERAT